MTTNVGNLDRMLRGALGVILILAAFFSGLGIFENSLIRYGAAVVGVVMLVVAITRICPLYSIFGIKTCRN